MNAIVLALQEIRVGMRNRWVLATTLLMAALALSLVLLGSAPVGVVKADALAVTVVSLSSLTIFLVPLIALLLSFDAIVGEHERGTLMLLLSYPVSRWEVVLGKLLGQVAILGVATVIGYGLAGGAIAMQGTLDAQATRSFLAMIGSSVMLGAVFIALGMLLSTLVRERATAAGLAVGVWLLFVIVFDMALLGVLVADQGRTLGQAQLDMLLLLNPTDVYRLFNTASGGAASVYSGMAGLGDAALASPALLLAVLGAWIVVPVILAVIAFERRAL